MAGRKIKLEPVHRGEILREDFMAPLALSINALARALRVPAKPYLRHRQREAGY